VYQLPLGIVGVAMGVVYLSELSRLWASEAKLQFNESLNQALTLALLLTFPACIALMIGAEPIVQSLFEYGAFSAKDSKATSLMLTTLSLGLPFYVLDKVFANAFFARENTQTPMKLALICVFVNAILGFMLFYALGIMGVTLALSLAGILNCVLLIIVLRREGLFRFTLQTRQNLLKILGATLFMGVVLWILKGQLNFSGGVTTKLPQLFLFVLCGGMAYMGALLAFKFPIKAFFK
jgi:putative peptidoglycan lipid II flippase